MPSVVSFDTITGMLDALVQKFASSARPILMWKSGGVYTGIGYREFGKWVEETAAGFAALGVRSGDRVAILSENRPEWVVSDMAMLRLGAVNVSLYPSLTPKQVEYILNDAGVSLALVSNRLQYSKIAKVRPGIPALRQVVSFAGPGIVGDDALDFGSLRAKGAEFARERPTYLAEETRKITPEHLLTLIYTSGTTGNPKGVMLTHANLVSNILASTSVIPFVEDDVLLSFLPLCHSYERMGGYYSVMSCGVTIAYAESVDTVRENLLEVRPTIVTTVPRLFERIYNGLQKQAASLPPLRKAIFEGAMRVSGELLRHPPDRPLPAGLKLRRAIAEALVFRKVREKMGGRIRFFVSGGAALPREHGEFFGSIGVTILEGYGMTESSPVISVNRPDARKFGTVGTPIPGVEVRIGADGEILVKGPNVMRGYWNDPAATAEAVDAEGWLHTGDIGSFDSEGYLSITDRKKHLIVSSGGKNIAPGPIEAALLSSELIAQALVIGNGRGHLSALIVPVYDNLRERISPVDGSARDDAALAASGEARRLIGAEIDRVQKDSASFERVRRFTLMARAFSEEEGEMTPTLKIRRSVVEKKYAREVEEMYRGVV